jgi:hypothetical protein
MCSMETQKTYVQLLTVTLYARKGTYMLKTVQMISNAYIIYESLNKNPVTKTMNTFI